MMNDTEFPVTYYRGRPHNHPQGTLMDQGSDCPACERFWVHHLVANNPPATPGPVASLIYAVVLTGLLFGIVEIAKWLA